MFHQLGLRSAPIKYEGYVPPLIQPLLDAASHGDDLVPVVDSITRGFGFDAFNCSVSINRWPHGESQFYVFTTMPTEWVAIYDQRSYVEIDPRVQILLQTPLPIVWDQSTFRGRNTKLDEFLSAGLEYGLGSGVAVGIFDIKGHAVMVALNSRSEYLDEFMRRTIHNKLPDIVLFAHFFHAMFVTALVDQSVPPRSQGAPLSRRERECLSYAARGLTGEDIANKLGITPRTVQFHFDSIRSKLGALNRQEAIAKATREGLISPD